MENSQLKAINTFEIVSEEKLSNINGSWNWRHAIAGAFTDGATVGAAGLISGPVDFGLIGAAAAGGFIQGGMN